MKLQEGNQRVYFNSNIQGDIIVKYPLFKVMESNGTRVLKMIGTLIKDDVETEYGIVINITRKADNSDIITDAIRKNLKNLQMLCIAVAEDIEKAKEILDKEVSSYYELLNNVCECLNKQVKDKKADIKVNVKAVEYNGKYYYLCTLQ
ncbi:MAG: hypothetical protein KatS3mg027_2333 [Bacteroidia bacterium]|nr:MAG: hypothetical protein KatS3mg027_2333 [Bacteroidia bacterium]